MYDTLLDYNNNMGYVPPLDVPESKAELIYRVTEKMSKYCNQKQLSELNKVLIHELEKVDIITQEKPILEDAKRENERLLNDFIDAKKLEGRSINTLVYYKSTLEKFLETLNKPVTDVRAQELRPYLLNYGETVSKVTLDNVRRIFSSFFAWLLEEEYIFRNPMNKIHRVKQPKTIKKPFSEYEIEQLRLACTNPRDRAVLELLLSTGIRITELIQLKKDDVDFHDRSIIVWGKGAKQREVYFGEQAELHLQRYLDSRTDNDPHLFLALIGGKPLQSNSSLISMFKGLSERSGVPKVHAHRFRRTMATWAVNHGMPIEQISQLLGHTSLETTQIYAIVDQSQLKYAHKKYIR